MNETLIKKPETSWRWLTPTSLSSWDIQAFSRHYSTRLCRFLLSSRPLPQHVAFIMDGNRRFGKKAYNSTKMGHNLGLERLLKVCEWCDFLDIKIITTFMFSIDNFKRSQEEVDYLMDLAIESFQKLKKLALDKDWCINFCGDISLLPPRVRDLQKEVHTETKLNSKRTINLCAAYTSSHEITRALSLIHQDLNTSQQPPLLNHPIMLEEFQDYLYTKNLPQVDLIIRTSGEKRLSDFMLWQGSKACLEFINVCWPQLSLWQLTLALLRYQSQLDPS